MNKMPVILCSLCLLFASVAKGEFLDSENFPQDLSQQILRSSIELGKLLEEHNAPEELVIENYKQAHRYSPSSIESLFYLARYFRKIKKTDQAVATAEHAIEMSEQGCTSDLWPWIGEYGMLWEYSLCAYEAGNYQEAIDVTRKLLSHPFPENHRSKLKNNLEFMENKLKVSSIERNY